jgi:hypothetical protein
MAHEPAILGIFSYLDDLLEALKTVKKEDGKILTVFSPIHFSEIQEIVGHKTSTVRYLTLIGGILGGTSLVGLGVYAHLSFKLITSGKPVIPPIPFLVPFFEGTILLAVIFTVLSWVLKGRLPRVKLPAAYDPRFSEDRFGVLVACPEGKREMVLKLLKDAGAEEVRDVSG